MSKRSLSGTERAIGLMLYLDMRRVCSEQNESVSSILDPVPCKDVSESKEISKCDLKKLDGSVQLTQVNFQNSVFNDCNISFWVKKD